MIRSSWRSMLLVVALMAITMGIVVLYLHNPAESAFYPRCPFYVVTGLQCPGCGTLRAMHCLVHGRFAEAWQFNPATIAAVPMIATALVFSRLAHSSAFGWCILVGMVAWWIGRNVLS